MPKKDKPAGLGGKELNVLRALQKGSSLPKYQIARDIGMSAPEFSRIRGVLETTGVIKRATVILDRPQLGFNSLGFFTVKCKGLRAVDGVAQLILGDPRAQEVHLMGGKHFITTKVTGRDNSDLAAWQGWVLGFDDVVDVRGEVVIQTFRESLDLPI